MDEQTNVVRFADGEHALPAWQLEFATGEAIEKMTHAQFVQRINGMLLRNATSIALETTMQGSQLARGLLQGRRQ